MTTDLYDLTTAFNLTRLFSPEPEPPSGDEDGEPSPDDSDDGHGSDDSGEGSGDDGNDDDVDNPRIKELSDEAAKWRRQFRAAEERIKALVDANGAEALQTENRELRIRLEFERAGGDFTDLEAAWILAQQHLPTVKTDDDGTPDAARVREIAAYVAKHHPYLVGAPEGAERATPTEPSGRPANGKRKSSQGATQQVLESKFPALRGMRRG